MTVLELAEKLGIAPSKIVWQIWYVWNLKYKETSELTENLVYELSEIFSRKSEQEAENAKAEEERISRAKEFVVYIHKDGFNEYNDEFVKSFEKYARHEKNRVFSPKYDILGNLRVEIELLELYILGRKVKPLVRRDGQMNHKKVMHYQNLNHLKLQALLKQCKRALGNEGPIWVDYELEMKYPNETHVAKELDLEYAKRIISLLNMPYSRQLLKESSTRRIEIIDLAKRVLDKYSVHVINILLTWPTYTINSEFDENFSVLSDRSMREAPLRLFHLRFIVEQGSATKNRQDIAIVFYERTLRTKSIARIYKVVPANKIQDEIGELMEDGSFKTSTKFEPFLNLFFNQTKKMLFTSLQNTHCVFCLRKLTEPDSILNNMGPTCAKNRSLIYLKYS